MRPSHVSRVMLNRHDESSLTSTVLCSEICILWVSALIAKTQNIIHHELLQVRAARAAARQSKGPLLAFNVDSPEDTPLLSQRSSSGSSEDVDSAANRLESLSELVSRSALPQESSTTKSNSAERNHKLVGDTCIAQGTVLPVMETASDDDSGDEDQVAENRTERVPLEEQARILDAKQSFWCDQLKAGQYDLDDVVRVVATTYYNGGDRVEEVLRAWIS